MRKLKLDVEKLEITSFATEAQERARGTVNGHGNQPAGTGPDTCLYDTCALGCETNFHTCGFTCGSVCAASMLCSGPSD